jgi:hypothetical protein
MRIPIGIPSRCFAIRTVFASVFLFGGLAFSFNGQIAHASNNFDGGGNSNWWFDPVNWGHDAGCATGVDPCYLPPIQERDAAPVFTDIQVNGGTGAWDITGEGVVYDPANDPFFADAANLTYVTGSALASNPSVMRDYGPESLYRLYVSRNTTNTNLITIKSGDLAIESTTIIGRSGSTAEASNLGRVNQTDGSVKLPLTSLDLGQREDSGPGNGTWDYSGGVLEVSMDGGNGLRLAPGGGAGTGGVGRFIMRNTETPGYVRAYDYNSAAHGANGDGMTTGVGITEFHFDNGGTRPIQVVRNLSINNGLDANLGGTRSSRLELVLDSAPEVDGGGVPGNLGLFDVDFDFNFDGVINGTGDLGNVFSSADASVLYDQDATVSALFGGTRYDWTISYTGTITWADADLGNVASVIDDTFGSDVVLLGLGSEFIGVPGLPGDYNDDGVVNAADYVVWRNADGTSTELPNRNPELGGDVGADDYTYWVNNFGNGLETGSAASAAVPEPAAALLLMLAALAANGVRKSRL